MIINRAVKRLALVCLAIQLVACTRVIVHENYVSKEFVRGSRYAVIKDSLPDDFSLKDTFHVRQFFFCSSKHEGNSLWRVPWYANEDSVMNVFLHSLLRESHIPLLISDSTLITANSNSLCDPRGIKRNSKRPSYADLLGVNDQKGNILIPVVYLTKIDHNAEPMTYYWGGGKLWRGYGGTIKLALFKVGKEIFFVESALGQQSEESYEAAQLTQEDWDLLVELAFKGLTERVERKR